MEKKGKSRKGQISFFIIIAVVIVIVLILIFVVRPEFKKAKISPEIAGINSFVENCVEETGENAIYHIGQTGGYFLYSNNSNKAGIAYYFDKNKKLIPSKESIENELALYMNEMLFFCTRNFVDFPNFDVNQEKIKSHAEISENLVIFNVDYKLSISKGDRTYFLESFRKEIPSRLDTIYFVASAITEEQMLNFEYICVNCISDLAFENKVFVDMNDDYFDNETIIFSIIDEQYKINNEDYVFHFANKYLRR